VLLDQPIAESPSRLNDCRAIQGPPGVVNDAQELQRLVATRGLPGITQVDANVQHPTRILQVISFASLYSIAKPSPLSFQMIVSVRDPAEPQHILGAYFVPYLWFPDSENPRRPYRIHKDDKYFWGHQIYQYHHRVQCGRIGFTITNSPVLFFKSEERQKIDAINYHILVRFEPTTLSQYLKPSYRSTLTGERLKPR
jgi:hypothetical protein